MEEIQINTSSHSYPLYIGSGYRFHVGRLLKEGEERKSLSSLLIITDSNVEKLYLNDLMNDLKELTIPIHTYVIRPGEESKSIEQFMNIQSFAIEKGLDRNSCMVAFGGGVVGDLVGFVAATFMRGISYIQVPTTLLAHDSSVGGKTAINHPLGKNMIGSFHQPDMVIYDTETLSSLSERELRSGYAEIIKHAMIHDNEFLTWLQNNIVTLEDLHGEKLIYSIMKGINVKAEIVRQDEREAGVRSFLNFGHTLAHAIETEVGYGTITHGEAVSIGMLFALNVSETLYDVDLNLRTYREWFHSYGFPHIPKEINVEKLIVRMKNDKKAMNNSVRMVVLREFGKPETVNINDDILRKCLVEEIRGNEQID
jgi:3-dehydroquinate synthase